VKRIAAVLALGIALTLSGCAPTEDVTISNPWVRASEYSDHVGGMTGVFMEITNNKSEPVTLVGGAAKLANLVEIHEMAMIGDELKMQKLENGLVIQPGETAVLEMGGYHVMLMDLKQAILAGDVVSLTLDFEGAEDIQLKDLVAKPSEGGDEEYHSEEMDH
jgi:copper(I)-binding protein